MTIFDEISICDYVILTMQILTTFLSCITFLFSLEIIIALFFLLVFNVSSTSLFFLMLQEVCKISFSIIFNINMSNNQNN